MSSNQFRAALIQWPADWKPADWEDIPQQIEILEVVEEGLTFSEVVRWVRRFNTSAMSSAARSTWGVILNAPGAAAAPPPTSQPEPLPTLGTPSPSTLDKPAPRDGRYGLA